MFRKIQTKLSIAFIGLAVLPILLLGTFISHKIYSAAEAEATKITYDTAYLVGVEVENFISSMVDHIEVVTWIHGLHKLPLPDQRLVMGELLASQSAYDEISILNPQGYELIRVNRTQVVSEEDLGRRFLKKEFQVPLQTKDRYFGPVLLTEKTGEPYMICSVPFFDPQSGKVNGIIVAELRLKKIWDLLASLKLRRGEEVYIADAEGRIVGHRNPSVVLRGSRTNITLTPDHTHGHSLRNQDAFIGDHHIVLDDQNLHVICEWAKGDALSLAYRMLIVIGLGTFVALATAILIMIPVVGNIVRPLQSTLR